MTVLTVLRDLLAHSHCKHAEKLRMTICAAYGQMNAADLHAARALAYQASQAS